MELTGSFFTLLSSEVNEGVGTYNLKLNGDHFIFRCHFPEQPIVPGVCLIQTLAELLSANAGRKLFIKEMHRVKFIRPVYPDQTPELSCQVTSYRDDEGTVSVSAVFTPLGEPGDILCRFSATLVDRAF